MKSLFKKSAVAGLVAAALLFGSACSRDGKSAGQSIDDSAITAKVKTAFAKDSGVKATEVKVDTHLGTVQLSGWVNTQAEKDHAEVLAKAVPGVKTVENKIVLKTDATQPAKK